MQRVDYAYYTSSEAGRRTIAENYVGLPHEAIESPARRTAAATLSCPGADARGTPT